MRFRLSLAVTTIAGFASLGAGCSGGSEETHGVDGNGKGGRGNGGSGTTLPGTGGSSGTITVGGTSAGGAAGNSSGVGGGTMDCARTTAMATPEMPVLMFLVDLSLSMNDPAPGSMQSKWIETRDALETGFMSMRDGTNVGLVFYPDVPTNSMPCFDANTDVTIAPLNAAQRASLDTALQMEMPSGSTPTHDAYIYALEQLRASTQRGQKYVVLITDGIPTYARSCEGTGQPMQMPPTPTQPLVDESALAMAGGIRTFVIGSPGSDGARESLSQMATQGGTARAGCSDTGPEYCHLDMTTEPDFSTALNAALEEVISGIPLTCDFNIPAPPPGETINLGQVNVTYTDGQGNAMPIGRDASLEALECTNGWQYTMDHTQVTLCGALCDQVKADPMATVTIVLGCTTIVEPP